jgi:hypothetical protein
LANLTSHTFLLQAAARDDAARPACKVQRVHQFRVTIHNHVRVVRDYDDLSISLMKPQLPNNKVVDEVIVQVVFWLIQDERFRAECKEECQHCRRSLTL